MNDSKKEYFPPEVEIVEIDKIFNLIMTSQEPPDDPEWYDSGDEEY